MTKIHFFMVLLFWYSPSTCLILLIANGFLLMGVQSFIYHGITLGKFSYWISRWKEGQSAGDSGLFRWFHLGRQVSLSYRLSIPTVYGWKSPRPI
ncbi:hypothetical protein [Parapedobacter sp.]